MNLGPSCSYRVRDILVASDCFGWSDFNNKSIDNWLKEEYNDNDTQSGVIFRFNRFDKARFEMVQQFQEHLMATQYDEVDLNDPCTWSIDIWSNLHLKENLKSINSQVGIDVNVLKPETTISGLSIPVE